MTKTTVQVKDKHCRIMLPAEVIRVEGISPGDFIEMDVVKVIPKDEMPQRMKKEKRPVATR